MTASISYQIKLSKSKQMDDLVDKLDDDATQSFDIVSVSHSRIKEFRKQLKIKAIQAAKDKAVYLTESINEKVGEAITINEPGEEQFIQFNNLNFQSNYTTQFERKKNSFSETDKTPEIDFKKIKLNYKVDVIFALK